jgi:DNA-binding transcriptional regulator YiaG
VFVKPHRSVSLAAVLAKLYLKFRGSWMAIHPLRFTGRRPGSSAMFGPKGPKRWMNKMVRSDYKLFEIGVQMHTTQCKCTMTVVSCGLGLGPPKPSEHRTIIETIRDCLKQSGREARVLWPIIHHPDGQQEHGLEISISMVTGLSSPGSSEPLRRDAVVMGEALVNKLGVRRVLIHVFRSDVEPETVAIEPETAAAAVPPTQFDINAREEFKRIIEDRSQQESMINPKKAPRNEAKERPAGDLRSVLDILSWTQAVKCCRNRLGLSVEAFALMMQVKPEEQMAWERGEYEDRSVNVDRIFSGLCRFKGYDDLLELFDRYETIKIQKEEERNGQEAAKGKG